MLSLFLKKQFPLYNFVYGSLSTVLHILLNSLSKNPIITTVLICSTKLTSPHYTHNPHPIPRELKIKLKQASLVKYSEEIQSSKHTDTGVRTRKCVKVTSLFKRQLVFFSSKKTPLQ